MMQAERSFPSEVSVGCLNVWFRETKGKEFYSLEDGELIINEGTLVGEIISFFPAGDTRIAKLMRSTESLGSFFSFLRRGEIERPRYLTAHASPEIWDLVKRIGFRREDTIASAGFIIGETDNIEGTFEDLKRRFFPILKSRESRYINVRTFKMEHN